MTDKILLIDDDIEHLQMLGRCFLHLGMKTTSAHSGVQALEILKRESFDLVVSDIKMPEVDGMEVLQFIIENAPETDVIMITGYSDKYTFTDVIRAGAADYLEKPFTKDAINAKVSRIFRERNEIARRKRAEEIINKKSSELEERVKELACLYGISRIIDNNVDKLELVLPSVVEIIPSGFQHPEKTAVRIICMAKEFTSRNFQETPWELSLPIMVDQKKAGSIEIYLLGNTSADSKCFFLKEEQDLLRLIADKVSRAADRQHMNLRLAKAREELHRSHQDLEEKVLQRTKDLQEAKDELITVFESVPDGIISVAPSMIIKQKNNRCMEELHLETGQFFQPGVSKFQQECHRILLNTLKNQTPIHDYRLEFNKGESVHKAFLVSTTCLLDKDGESKGALLVIHDITEVVVLENKLHERRKFRQMVGESRQMQEIFQYIRQIASVEATVLITGESGVGKELIVDTIHARGDRAKKPLVKVNCSALPENLLESELFGHVKGAFTGASRDRTGRIELAEGGILFLDEIGDISLRLQLQLLRFLESKEFEKVGDSRKRTADVRVFAATNADLFKKVKNGTFREDLYYRLKVMVIHVPALRERIEDVPLFVDHFMAIFNDKFNKKIAGISQEALDAMMTHQWRGNIRELKHAFEHAFLLCHGATLELAHFPKDMFTRQDERSSISQPARVLTRETVLRVLSETRWHRTETAKRLNISRATLYNKLKEFGLTKDLS